jgi:nucleoside-diphosphate-sugar epimerase
VEKLVVASSMSVYVRSLPDVGWDGGRGAGAEPGATRGARWGLAGPDGEQLEPIPRPSKAPALLGHALAKYEQERLCDDRADVRAADHRPPLFNVYGAPGGKPITGALAALAPLNRGAPLVFEDGLQRRTS